MRCAGWLLALAIAAGAHAGEPADASAATAALYERMSAGDLAGVARLLPSDGFTELDGDAVSPHRVDAAAFAGLFKSGARVSLHAAGLQEQRVGDTAIVTGTRVGAIADAKEASVPFTMVWTRDGSRWTLRHVHLSSPH
jgi:ketosteroid isomerase-like protein